MWVTEKARVVNNPGWRPALWYAFSVFGIFSLLSFPAFAAAVPSFLEFAPGQAFELTQNKLSSPLEIVVLNTGYEKRCAELDVFLYTVDGSTIKPTSSSKGVPEVAEFGISVFSLTLAVPVPVPVPDADADAKAPVAGYVVLRTKDCASRSLVTFRVAPLRIQSSASKTSSFLLAISGVAALLLATLSWLVARSKHNPRLRIFQRMGSPTWDFSKSWASNISIAGGLIGAVLAMAVLPEQLAFLSRRGYLGINLFCFGLVTLAPVYYTFLSSSVSETGADGSIQKVNRGTVLSFLFSGLLTSWGSIGQVVILTLLVTEVGLLGLVPSFAILIFQILLAGIAIGLLIYIFRTMVATLDTQAIDKSSHDAVRTEDSSVKSIGWNLL